METDKRKSVRKRTDQLLYAEFGADNGSILLNLSEEGCSFQSLAPVRTELVRFSVSVGDGHKLEGNGQMMWSDPAKKTGGVCFLNPSQELREQVRLWLSQTLVTTDRKLDPAAVESEAKLRRRKLREAATAEDKRAKRERTPQNEIEKLVVGSRPALQVRAANTANTREAANPITIDGSRTDAAFGNSAATVHGIGMIILAALLVTALATYRRELGHLVMTVGSNIAGERGATAAPAKARPAPMDTSQEIKVVATPGRHDSASESGGDTGDTAHAEFVRTADLPAVPGKRLALQQEAGTEDVSSLWTSVENGDTGAEVTLASRYVRGDGVPQSCAQARVLLEAAMKRGSLEAKQKLNELALAGCP